MFSDLLQNAVITGLIVAGLLYASTIATSNNTVKETAMQFNRLTNVLGGR